MAGENVPRLRVAAIIVRDGTILLARHVKKGKTYWLLPGGGVEYGESLEEALVREVKEETNLSIRVVKLVFVNDSIPPDGHRHVVNLYFTAEVLGGEVRQGPDDVIAELRFVPIAELPSLLFYPDIREVLLPALRTGFPEGTVYLGNMWDTS